jgi:hypothetical protein
MSNGGTITIVGAKEEPAAVRGGPSQVTRVTDQIAVDELRRKFQEFMESLEAAFAVEAIQTEAGVFRLDEIQFSVELSAHGDFKLLGTGVGVAAGSTLSFTLGRKDK